MLRDGKLNAYWVQVNNNLQAAANVNEEGYPGYRNPENFIVVSDAYPTVTAQAADLVSADRRCGSRRKAPMATPSAARTSGTSWSNAPGESALRSLAAHGVLQALQDRGGLARRIDRQEAGVRGKTLFDVLFKNGEVDKFPVSDIAERLTRTTKSKAFGFYVQKGLFEEYAEFGRGHGHDLAPFDAYHEARGLRWPVVNGKETRWRYREGYDPYVKDGKGVEFYGFPDGKARIFALPYEPPAESPDTDLSLTGWSPAACSSTGTPAR